MRLGLWLPGIALLAGLVGCSASAEHADEGTGPEDEEAHVTVRTEAARRGDIAEEVDGLGRVEALPDHLATLTPAVEGHVEALSVKQGEWVQKGHPIVELNRAAALADLAEKTASRDTLKASLVLLRSLPRPEEQRPLVLAVEQARVAYDRAKRTADEIRKLRADNLASAQQLYDADKVAEAARLQLDTAESQHHVQIIGPRPEAVAEAEAKIKTAEGLVEFSKAHLEFHTIRSPIDGVLDSLTCHPGQTIAVGAPIGEVVDTRQVFAAVWLPTRSVAAVRVGQPAQVWFADSGFPAADASAEEGHDTSAEKAPRIAGQVAFVGRIADPQTGNLPVRILVENPDGRLTIGQSVRVSITVGERKDALQVPAVAILDLGEGPVLNVVRDGKSAVLHPEAGEPHGGWVPVSGTDLKEGEPVIVEGGYNLPEGTPVKVLGAEAVAQAEARP
jgi:RND family efflux transporter MFP subunit